MVVAFRSSSAALQWEIRGRAQLRCRPVGALRILVSAPDTDTRKVFTFLEKGLDVPSIRNESQRVVLTPLFVAWSCFDA